MLIRIVIDAVYEVTETDGERIRALAAGPDTDDLISEVQAIGVRVTGAVTPDLTLRSTRGGQPGSGYDEEDTVTFVEPVSVEDFDSEDAEAEDVAAEAEAEASVDDTDSRFG